MRRLVRAKNVDPVLMLSSPLPSIAAAAAAGWGGRGFSRASN